MAKKTSSLARKIYKSFLLVALGAVAFILKLQNNNPTGVIFNQAHAEIIDYGSPDSGGPAGAPSDCPSDGPGPCGPE